MPVENQADYEVEVLGVLGGVDEELLSLYFENKRRSGGGPLVSVEKKGDRALLVFEEAEVAARVLTKVHHVLHNAELTVRRPASKDPQALLLRGISSNTNIEMVEMYVENMLEIDNEDYALYPSPRSLLYLIYLHSPLSKDFQTVSAMVSNQGLNGCTITLEQAEQTDSVLVEGLHPGFRVDMLTLYFESSHCGDHIVKEITKLSETSATVSFLAFESVAQILEQAHKLEDAELVVRPYFAFLHPADSSACQNGAPGNSANGISQPQTAPPPVAGVNSPPLAQTALNTAAAHPLVESAIEEAMVELSEETQPLPVHIAVPEQAKLALFQHSNISQNIQRSHPNIDLKIRGDGVHITGPDRLDIEQLRNTIREFLGNICSAHLTFDLENAQFLAKQDVKDRLLAAMNHQWTPITYTVSDCDVEVTSLSTNLRQACDWLKSQPCSFSLPVDKEYECMLYSNEWRVFIQDLGFCSVKVLEGGAQMSVVTLAGMESDKTAAIVTFLTTPIEIETVISMEPGMLKYIQTFCHQLLADMDQVSILPLEAACGLKIQGKAGACQMADELLRAVVSSVCTRTITLHEPGVARFLAEEGRGLLEEMQAKFQVYIDLRTAPWEPLQNGDIFDAAWKKMARQNFQKFSVDGCDQSDGPARGLIEAAKKIVSSIDEKMEVGPCSSNSPANLEEEDLYTSGEPSSLSDQQHDDLYGDVPGAFAEGDVAGGPLSSDGALGLPSNLEEEAQLSLAIQYSMELLRDLEMSQMTPQERSNACSQFEKMDTSVPISLQENPEAANSAQIFVYAAYKSDLIRVDIALGKKISMRHTEERVEHKGLKNMSEYHKTCLELFQRKHAVGLKLLGNIATISGFRDYVESSMSDFKMLLQKIANSTCDAEILRTVQWVREDPSSGTTPYAPNVVLFIETSWQLKKLKIDISLNNEPHIISLEKMQEQNVTTGKAVPISRKLLSSTDLLVDDEDFSLLSSLPEVSKVHEDSDEFQEVVKDFYFTIQEYHSKIRIIKVEKVMNQLLCNQYKLKKASIIKSAVEPTIERTLYHGTCESSVKEICVHGFNRSFCGKNATIYGQGVYFAVNSALSVQDQYSPQNGNGHKFVFVTKVLTGDYTTGNSSMKTAPLKDSDDIPLRYDSVTDNISKPSMFVIFNDTQAYPEYLITCQRIRRLGDLRS